MSLQVNITKGHEGAYMIALEGRLDTNSYLDFEERIAPVLIGILMPSRRRR